MGDFMNQRAPNGSTWADYCRGVTPTLDSSGLVSGPWGEAMHNAVAEEMKPNWESRFSDGPAGQVISCMEKSGYGSFTGAISNNEERTKQAMQSGNYNYVFQGDVLQGNVVTGQVIPHHPGAPGGAGGGTPVVVGIPIMQRLEQAQSSGRLPPKYSDGACRSGASILDQHPLMPEHRTYKDVPFAICFVLVVIATFGVAGAFMNEISLLIERSGTTYEVFEGKTCGLSDPITEWPTGANTQVEGIKQRLVKPDENTDTSSSSRLLSESGPELVMPGLSPFMRRLELLGLGADTVPPGSVLDLDDEDDEEEAELAPEPLGRRLATSRRRTAQKEPEPPKEQDCERACAAFEECGAFEVYTSDSAAACVYYKDVGSFPEPIPATGTVSCWRKEDAKGLSNTAKSFLGTLFGLTLVAAFVSMLAAVAFVRCSATQPKITTYIGIYFVPVCMIIAGLLVLTVLFPFVGGAALLFGLVLMCCGSCFLACMCWCYRDLIPLTIEVVQAVATIISRHNSMFAVSFCGTLIGLVWSFVCSCAFIGVDAYQSRQDVLVPQDQIAPAEKYVTYPKYFIECFIYFWGAYTVYNLCHTAYCGIFGRWYFGLTESLRSSLRVATTYSFGTVCMGSFIIAFIRAMEQVAKKMKRDSESEGNMVGCVIGCLLECIIRCIGDIIEWISQYVYVQVALRGLGFIDGAKATYALATVSNLIYVVSAMLVDYVAFLGAVLCAIAGAAVAGLLGYATCGIPGFCAFIGFLCAIFGCCAGLMAGGTAVGIMNSGSVSVLMCWAERPDTLEKTNPEIARKFQAGVDKAFGQ